MRDLLHESRLAVRSLKASRGFTAIAVATLALGIGATTSIYSVVDAILLQPLPYADSGRLVRVVENVPSNLPGRPQVQRGATYQEFLEWRGRSRTLSEAAAIIPLGQRMVRAGDGTARLWGAMTSGNTFTLLGTRALVGRVLTAADDERPDVVVLSHDTWRRVFHADPHIVGGAFQMRTPEPMFNGRSATLEGRILTIVGVVPAGFEPPIGQPMDFYTPFLLDPTRRSPNVTMIARLGRNVSVRAAFEEANIIGEAIRPPRPANAPPIAGPRFEVQPLKDQIVEPLRPALRVLLASVAFVLLIVCANVANLLLARGTARQRETAVRIALGASRGRVVRHVLTECAVLAVAGGALGALAAAGGVMLVKQLASVDAPGIFRLGFGTSVLPRGSEVAVNVRMFGIAFATAALTSMLFGALPALHLSRTQHLHAMGSRGSGAGGSRVRSALVVCQLVMATVLLIGAGLLIASFVKLSTVEKGYDPSQVVALQLVFPADYSISRKVDTIEATLARLRAMPEVEAAGFTRAGILIAEAITTGTFVPPGRTVDEMRAEPIRPLVRPVSRGYLTAAGVPILMGREFSEADLPSSPPAIVIGRSVAVRYFGTANPVGQIVNWHVGNGPPAAMQVAGVVEDIHNTRPDAAADPAIFVEYRQLLALQQRWGDTVQRQNEMSIGFLSFAIRTKGQPASAIPAIARLVRSVDESAGIDALIPMERLAASAVARQRFNAILLAVFAGVAGLLAAIGVYGVLAYTVAQRTQEIGIRMALGARRAQVLRLILQKGLVLTVAGITLGLAGATAATRLLQGMLFGVTPLDPRTFAGVSLLFGVVATVAAYVPARRATKVDPIVALRMD